MSCQKPPSRCLAGTAPTPNPAPPDGGSGSHTLFTESGGKQVTDSVAPPPLESNMVVVRQVRTGNSPNSGTLRLRGR